jgi:hypothetical protein
MSYARMRTVAAIAASLALTATLATVAHAAPVCGDVNDNDSVTSSDALAVLRYSVGQQVDLICPDFLAHYGFETDRDFSAPWGTGYLFGVRVSVATSVTVTHLGLYSREAGNHVKMALYSDAAGSPANLLASTPASELVIGGQEIALSQATAISPGFYWIMASLDADTDLGSNDQATPDNTIKYRELPFASDLPSSFGTAETDEGITLDFWMRVIQ